MKKDRSARWLMRAALALLPFAPLAPGCGAPPEVTASGQALVAAPLACLVPADPAGNNKKCDGTSTHKASYAAPASPVSTGLTDKRKALEKCVDWAIANQPAGAAGKVECGACPAGCKAGGCQPFEVKGSDDNDVKKRGTTYDCGTAGEINVTYKCTQCELLACEPPDAIDAEGAVSLAVESSAR